MSQGRFGFLGPNGQGKTNLIEAIFYLLRGESFRPGDRKSFMLQPSSGPTWMKALVRREDWITKFKFL